MTKTRDLADLGGGFIQAGTGAVQRTVESKPCKRQWSALKLLKLR